MFSQVLIENDFDQPNTYAVDWNGTYVAPNITDAGLQFGPHPTSPNWWETFGLTMSRRNDLGDVLLCVRFRMTVTAGPEENAFEVSIRGAEDGMVLKYSSGNQLLSLYTKTAAAEWVVHASAGTALSAGDHQLELALYGKGNAFAGELRDLNSGVIPVLTSYALPATGVTSMMGSQLSHPLIVTRAVVGTPTPASAARILAHL
jgi:hypothetical protein